MASFAADIDAIFSEWNAPDSPGCAVLITVDGDPLYRRGHGLASLEHGAPITSATVFNVGSISKQFTAMAILLLEDEGQLTLDDDIRRYVPELPDLGTPMTIGHLLTHTSGLREQSHLLALAGWRDGDVVAERDVLDLVTRQRALDFAPGEDFQYNNTGYTLLASTVRRVSGLPLRTYADQRILKPLGMAQTFFNDDHTTIVRHRADAYGPGPDGRLYRWMPASDHVGPTNLFTSVEDLVRWSDNFVRPRVGSPRLIERLTTPGRLNDGRLHGYACGLEIGRYRGLRLVSHGGIQHGYRARLALYPDQRFAVAILANLGTIAPGPLVRRITDAVIDHGLLPGARAAPALHRVTLTQEELTRHCGLYLDARTGGLARVSLDDGRLMLGWPPAADEMIPLAPDRFRVGATDVEAVFVPTQDGHARLEAIGSAREIESTLGRRVYTWRAPAHPTAEQLEDYTGRYESPDVGSLEFVAGDGTLIARTRKGGDVPLTPTFRDAFFDRGLFFYTFVRDPRDSVSSVLVSTDRIRALPFARRAMRVPLRFLRGSDRIATDP
jgi:CubicO group peptidase (beta-lactamase class C family)